MKRKSRNRGKYRDTFAVIGVILFLFLLLGIRMVMPYLSFQGIDETKAVANLQSHGKKEEESKKLNLKEEEKQPEKDIVTMYLTVSSGNHSENTDHTWSEINDHSVYYYEKNGIERYAVEGLLQIGDENGPQAGEFGYDFKSPNCIVTIRGQTSSLERQKNYKIKIKDEKGMYDNQKVINLNKHVTDGVRFRNFLMYHLMEKIPNMVSMETQFVHLYVKDTTSGGVPEFMDYGLYTQVEQPNKQFLKNHGLDPFGQLYKINFFEFYPYSDVIMLKSDADYDEKEFEKHLEIKGSDDHSKLIAMLKDVNNYDIPIEETLEKWFEEDNLYTWLAFHILTGNLDTQSRNTVLYSPKNQNTFYFISWDNDAAFRRTENRILERKGEDSSWENGISNYWGNQLFNRILKEVEGRKKLDQKIEEVKAVLSENLVKEQVQKCRKIVEPYRAMAPDNQRLSLSEEQFDEVCRRIPSEIAENYQKYCESKEKPMPFFIGEIAMDNHIHFVWGTAFDFQQDTITYSIEVADNYDFEHVIFEADDLYLPEYEYQNKLPKGQYFVRVKAKNQKGFEQYAFDYYVTKDSQKIYGVKCFYVLENGEIVEDIHVEGE